MKGYYNEKETLKLAILRAVSNGCKHILHVKFFVRVLFRVGCGSIPLTKMLTALFLNKLKGNKMITNQRTCELPIVEYLPFTENAEPVKAFFHGWGYDAMEGRAEENNVMWSVGILELIEGEDKGKIILFTPSRIKFLD